MRALNCVAFINCLGDFRILNPRMPWNRHFFELERLFLDFGGCEFGGFAAKLDTKKDPYLSHNNITRYSSRICWNASGCPIVVTLRLNHFPTQFPMKYDKGMISSG